MLLGYLASYVASYADDLGDETALPLSRVCPVPEGAETSALETGLPLLTARIRSPFAALCGLDDRFTSVEELCETTRAGIALGLYAYQAFCIPRGRCSTIPHLLPLRLPGRQVHAAACLTSKPWVREIAFPS